MDKIKRDEHNQLDKDDADRVIKKVTEDLITTQRDYQKEMSFRNARTDRRDVVVKIVIYQRNTVNGRFVRSDMDNPLFERLSDDPLDASRYRYFDHIDGEILAKEMPMPMGKAGKFTMGCFKAMVNYLARMNVFNET